MLSKVVHLMKKSCVCVINIDICVFLSDAHICMHSVYRITWGGQLRAFYCRHICIVLKQRLMDVKCTWEAYHKQLKKCNWNVTFWCFVRHQYPNHWKWETNQMLKLRNDIVWKLQNCKLSISFSVYIWLSDRIWKINQICHVLPL